VSVQTEADNCRDRAKENVKQAIQELNDIVIREVWGHDDYNPEYREGLYDAMIQLIAVRKLL
jgi:hypothetical protein